MSDYILSHSNTARRNSRRFMAPKGRRCPRCLTPTDSCTMSTPARRLNQCRSHFAPIEFRFLAASANPVTTPALPRQMQKSNQQLRDQEDATTAEAVEILESRLPYQPVASSTPTACRLLERRPWAGAASHHGPTATRAGNPQSR